MTKRLFLNTRELLGENTEVKNNSKPILRGGVGVGVCETTKHQHRPSRQL